MAPGLTTPRPAAPKQNVDALQQIVAGWDNTLTFFLNGTKVELENIDPEVTLLEYLRGTGLTGTKLGCAEGGCGACTVVVSQLNPTTKKVYHASVNACLAPLVSVDGKHVITVEGIGSSTRPHPVQERIALMHGSQCGFCTPGIVMSLYALVRNNPSPTEHEVEEAFDGNLCRCTGYRPILDAAHTFSSAASPCSKAASNGGSGCCMDSGSGPAGGCCKKMKSLDGDEPPQRFTPPNFIKYRPDTELIFPPSLHKYEMKAMAFGNKKKRWLRPVTMSQLLEIKNALPSSKIIGGSTETQIEVKFKNAQYTNSVYVGDIAELKEFKIGDNDLTIGGNITLTDLEKVAKDTLAHFGPERGQPFAAIIKQLEYFAGRQIRNVGTPGGNLATASPISDLNPVFMATNSILVAQSLEDGEFEIPMNKFFKGYRTTALPPNAIIKAIRVPAAAPKGEFVRAYKQSKRKDDDIAIVSAALRIRLNNNSIVEDVDLVYGGMAPTTVQARKATEYLHGKKWGDPKVLENAMNALEEDFPLKYGVPGGMAVYRKSLAFGFFYRFWHDTSAIVAGKSVEEDLVNEIKRNISTGTRDNTAAKAYEQKVLGKSKEHVAAMKQVTGEAQYTDDMPLQQGELHACLVLSTKAHAKLLKVDPSAALELPGVKGWVDHTDLPNPDVNFWGAPVRHEPFFAVDEVYTDGQPIGAIVASTAGQAAAGARAVLIEYEDLPAILTTEEAIEKESFFNHHHYIRKGRPIAEALASADRVITGVVKLGGQEHFYLETNASVAIPKREGGEMEIWSSTQNPTETQSFVANALGVPANRVVAKVKRLGGGFGGKETRSIQLAGICAIAAKKMGKPVRCMLNRDEDMRTSGARHPFLAYWKVGVNNDGKLVALDVDVYCNGGWTQDLSAAVTDRALSHIDGVYKFESVDVRGTPCRTNTVSNTAFRGFGGPQGLFIAETYMEEVADHLGMPVDKLREINLYHEGDVTHFNQKLNDYHIPLLIKQLKEESNYESRRKAVDDFNATHKWKKRGLSLLATKFGISFTALFLNQAGALVHIYHDGSILLAHGGTEMGQGLHTKMIQIAAEALQVPLDSIHIAETATNTVANTSPTAASASSDLNGYAIFNACEQLNERLQPYRQKLGPDATMEQLATAAYFDRVNLSANGFYKTPDIGYIWGANTGQMFFYFTQGAALAEVEIDCLTGDWTCLRADVKMDIGRSINPAIDYGQIEGAFVQGQGLFTTEELLWTRNNGRLFTTGPGNYKIPGFRDVPQEFNVSMLKDVEWKELRTIQRSRGVGEPPLFLGASVFFAIRDAVKARRRDGEGLVDGVDGVHGEKEKDVLRFRSPATTERIRLACADEILRRAYVAPEKGEEEWFVTI